MKDPVGMEVMDPVEDLEKKRFDHVLGNIDSLFVRFG